MSVTERVLMRVAPASEVVTLGGRVFGEGMVVLAPADFVAELEAGRVAVRLARMRRPVVADRRRYRRRPSTMRAAARSSVRAPAQESCLRTGARRRGPRLEAQARSAQRPALSACSGGSVGRVVGPRRPSPRRGRRLGLLVDHLRDFPLVLRLALLPTAREPPFPGSSGVFTKPRPWLRLRSDRLGRLHFGALALALLVALGLTGCLSIRTQTTFQRAAGVVSLKVVVCASDADRNRYATCDPQDPGRNVAEGDNLRADSDSAGSGQLLLGFRVPDGSAGPGSFLSDAQDVGFTRSPSYTQRLNDQHPPAPGFHWEGYISTRKDFDPTIASTRETAATVEFTLPLGAGGAPFAGPYLWRAVAGFRQVAPGEEGTPVTSCTCFDTPPADRIPVNLEAPVSDFGVLAGSAATAAQRTTATVSLPVSYQDAGNLGERDLTITATTNLPGGTATPSVTTLRVAPGSTTPVEVAVPVPAGTPLGSYTVTLSAATGSPEVRRSNTATIEVVDRIAPVIQIGTPGDGATFALGQAVAADYACAEELNGSGLETCAGPVAPGAAIDTATAGTKSFQVNASDKAGNSAALTRTYTVVAPPPRRILVSLTFNFTARRRSTKFSSLVLKDVPRGSRVRVTCKGKKKGRRCRIKPFKRTNARRNLRLKTFLRKPIPVGALIEARVTQPGKVGAVKQLRIRRKKAPTSRTLCLPPGVRKPQKC